MNLLRQTIRVLFVLATVQIGGAAPPEARDRYTRKMFSDALDRGGFVLITVRYPANGPQRRFCTMSTFLEGAIHIEYGLDYDTPGNKRAEEVALNRWNGVISFSKRKAFENIRPKYTSEQLDDVRNRLAKFGSSDLRKFLRSPSSELDRFYIGPKHAVYTEAIAHVLLERGISVGIDDRTGLLAPLPPN